MGVFEQSKQKIHAAVLAASGLLTGCVLPPHQPSSERTGSSISADSQRVPVLFGTRATGPIHSPRFEYYLVGESDPRWGLHYELRENPALYQQVKRLNDGLDPLAFKPGEILRVPPGWLTERHNPPSSPLTTPKVATEQRAERALSERNFPQHQSELSPPPTDGDRAPLAEPTLSPAPDAAENSASRELTLNRSYCIQRGDTLSKIAERYLGDSRRSEEIVALNADRGIHIEARDLPVGMHIVLPAEASTVAHQPAAQFIRIEAEDTLWKLSEIYLGDGKRWGDLELLNPGISPTSLRVGYLLQVSGAPSPTPEPPAAPREASPARDATASTAVRVPALACSVSPRCIEFIRKFERPPATSGAECVAYQDDAGVWTIGWGHTRGVKPGDRISFARAEELLREDLGVAERDIRACVAVPLCQNEYDALVSAFFNIGGRFRDSSAIRALNAGDRRAAAEGLLLWNKIRVNGELTPAGGLVRRRVGECLLFCGPPEMTADEAYISYNQLKAAGTNGLVAMARTTTRDRYK